MEEVKNPSSADLEVQLQRAALLISEMEDEPPLLSAQAALKGGAKWFGSGRQGPGQGPASASAKSSGGPKATRARKGDNPAVAVLSSELRQPRISQRLRRVLTEPTRHPTPFWKIKPGVFMNRTHVRLKRISVSTLSEAGSAW